MSFLSSLTTYLYVGDLPPHMTKSSIADLFATVGRISSIQLAPKWDSGQQSYASVLFKKSRRARIMIDSSPKFRSMQLIWYKTGLSDLAEFETLKLAETEGGAILVENLREEVKKYQISSEFTYFGKIVDIKLFLHATGQSAHVYFSSKTEAKAAALETNGQVLLNQPMRVTWIRFGHFDNYSPIKQSPVGAVSLPAVLLDTQQQGLNIQKQSLAGKLYPLVYNIHPDKASQIMDVLINLDAPQLSYMLGHPEFFAEKVGEVLRFLG